MRQERKIRVEYKRIKNMYLRIDEDGTLHVTCPRHITKAQILKFIEEKQAWIARVENKRTQPTKIQHELTGSTNDTAVIFGKKYHVTKIIDTRNYIELVDDTLEYHLENDDPDVIDQLFYQYTSQAMIRQVERLKPMYDVGICQMNRKKIPVISYRYMKSRWGSCTPAKSTIRLNVRLVHYPIECLNYVLLHEYAHLLVANHSKQFYAVVSQFMPDYKEAERILRYK